MNADKLQKEHYVRVSLFSLGGPLLWVIHFAVVYVVQHVLCSVYGNTAETTVTVLILIMSLLLVIALVIYMVRAPALLRQVLHLDEGQNIYAHHTLAFLHFMMRALAGLSLLGILWASVAVVFLTSCGPPY